MKSKWIKIGSLFIALVLSISALYIYIQSTVKNSALAESTSEITLTKPPFLTDAAATYLDQEAGIAYYVNTTGPLNLNTAKGRMKWVENETADYIIGVLDPGGWSSDDYPHCFVHKDGWIVVYYLKINPANPSTTGWLGKIIDWSDRDPISDPITSNLLYDALLYIGTPFSVNMANAKYYHFQYPAATKLLFAIKAAGGGQTTTFNIKIPGTCTVYERSWSCYSTTTTSDSYTFKIDATQISKGGGRRYGGPEITEAILSPDVFHTISIQQYYSYNSAYVCLILLYSC
ncbi:MAG: hypothetical protein QXJ02_04800 [Candidatus Bathyarchaeia archaeon]